LTDHCSNYKRYKQEEERNGDKGIATTIKHSSELKTKKTTVQRQSKQKQNEQQQCNTAAGPVSISQNINSLTYFSLAFRCILFVMTRKNQKIPACFFQMNQTTTESLLSRSEEQDSLVINAQALFPFHNKKCSSFILY
jgi:hypothetical protein